MVEAIWFGSAFNNAFKGNIDVEAVGKIKCMLCTSSFTPDQDSQEFKDDISNEVTAGGEYVAGGEVMTTVAVNYNSATNTFYITADDVVWENATITARYAVIYNDAPALEADKPLICYVDFEVDYISTNGDYTIDWSADGVVKVIVDAPA